MGALIFALTTAVWLVAGAPPGGARPQPQQQQRQQQAVASCGDVLRVPQRSFQQLPSAKYAYVWVDDIRTRIFSRHYPFAVFVIVGGVYPPFQAASGKLDRTSLDKLTASAYGTKRFGPLEVTDATIASGSAALSFEAGGRKFSLRIVSVDPSFGGEDAAKVQVCGAAK